MAEPVTFKQTDYEGARKLAGALVAALGTGWAPAIRQPYPALEFIPTAEQNGVRVLLLNDATFRAEDTTSGLMIAESKDVDSIGSYALTYAKAAAVYALNEICRGLKHG